MIKLIITHDKKNKNVSKILKQKLRYRVNKFFDAYEEFKYPSSKVKEFAIEQNKLKQKIQEVGSKLKINNINCILEWESPKIFELSNKMDYKKYLFDILYEKDNKLL